MQKQPGNGPVAVVVLVFAKMVAIMVVVITDVARVPEEGHQGLHRPTFTVQTADLGERSGLTVWAPELGLGETPADQLEGNRPFSCF